MQLKDAENLLSEENFVRIHKSYIINVNKIKFIDKRNSHIIMNDDHEIPFSNKKSLGSLIKNFNL